MTKKRSRSNTVFTMILFNAFLCFPKKASIIYPCKKYFLNKFFEVYSIQSHNVHRKIAILLTPSVTRLRYTLLHLHGDNQSHRGGGNKALKSISSCLPKKKGLKMQALSYRLISQKNKISISPFSSPRSGPLSPHVQEKILPVQNLPPPLSSVFLRPASWLP